MRYRAFISYSHADAGWARWLHRSLEGYRVPRRLRGRAGEFGALPERLAPVFRDREDLASAGELGPRIEAALEDSEALLVVCSPAAARSPWVNQEIQHFRRLGRGARIYCLIVAGEPGSGTDAECFPAALRGHAQAEPLAADVRPGKDGKALARHKLLAGLLGVPLDELRQREAARRHRRLLAVAALALLVALTTSFLALQAMVARDAAERRQKQAEALVGFMLGDLSDKLAKLSRLDILESVNDQAMHYFEGLPTTDLTDESLAQRAQALVKIGNVRMDQGHLPAAQRSYRAAAVLAGRLARAAPADLDRQLAYAEVLAFIGTTHWYQGELAQAQRRFQDARAVLHRPRGSAAADPRLLFQLSTLDNNIGHVLEGRGQLAAAAARYRDMLASARALAVVDPDNREWAAQRGLAHNNLAKMALLRGELEVAVREYARDVGIEHALAAAEPGDNAQAERLVLARAALGRTLALTGDVAGATTHLRQALQGADRLVALESGSTGFQEDRGLYATQLARLLRITGQAPEAARLARRGVEDFRRLSAADPGHPGWRRGLAEALLERAQHGGRAQAQADSREALAILEALLREQPADRDTVLATARAALLLAEAAPASPPGAANALRQRSLRLLRAQAAGREDPRLQALQVDALLALGAPGQARALLPALWRSGYRDPELARTLARHGLPTAPAAARPAGQGPVGGRGGASGTGAAPATVTLITLYARWR